MVLSLSVPIALRAQSAADIMRAQRNGTYNDQAGYGANPYDDEEEGEEGMMPQDSTKKQRMRKPLESYYFNDSIRALPNFEWYVNRNFNRLDIHPIDTLLNDWRIDYPFYRKGVGDMAIGSLGQASQPLDYNDRQRQENFSFSQPYYIYNYTLENVPFYNVKKPFILMSYRESGQKRYREENFGITVAQNISPSSGFNVNYNARGTKGKYEWSRTKNHNTSVAFSHTGKRYSVFAAYLNNHIEQRENGGVVGLWAVRDTTFEMPSGVPMKLASAEAQNIYRNNAVFVKQVMAIPLQRVTDYDFSLADLSTVYIGHTFEYNTWSKTYTDKYATYTNDRGDRNENGEYIPTQGVYYDHWYIDPLKTRDSLCERVISNRVYVQAQPWRRDSALGTLDGGVGVDVHTYSQFAIGDYLSGRYVRDRRTSWFVYGSIDGRIKKYVEWNADFKLYPSGYRGGDISIGGDIAFKAYVKGHMLRLSGRFRQESRSADYWHEHLFTNHFVWNNSFDKENETRFEAALTVPDYGIEVGVKQGVYNNKIFYNDKSVVTQHNGAVSLTSIYARKDFTIKGLHLNHRVLVQFSSDQTVAPVPLVGAYISYYYEFWVKRDVLRLQAGIDGRFNTAYYAPGYNPALSVFYNQREWSTGNYPYLDAFITAKWKRMRIFLKYQHFNKGLFGNNEYFSVAGYPLNPGMFKMGISWGFYD
ncbi:MAG: putative porin [Alistipes sp.]|nr:putative porin [Alistipes sp.]